MEKQTLWRILKGHRLRFVLGMACVVGAAFLTFIPQQIVRFTVDTVIGGGANTLPGWTDGLLRALGGIEAVRTHLWLCALAMIAVAVLNGGLTFLRNRLIVSASERSLKRLRERLYDHLQRLPYASLLKMGTGDLLQRSTSDVQTIRRFLATQMTEIVRALCLIIFALFIMLPMSPTMTLVSLGCIPILLVFSFVYYKGVRRYYREVDESEGRMSIVLQESLTGVRVVRAFGQQKREAEKLDRTSADFRDKSLHLLNMMSLYWSLSDLVIYVQIAICTIVGVILSRAGTLSVGTLISFIAYTSTLLWPIRQMGRVLADLGKSHVAMERIDEILHVPTELDEHPDNCPPIQGDVVFDHVSFGYDDGKDVLTDVSFTVKQGQTVAILGATGSGKSTMMLLLQRLYQPRSGHILIDGQDINALSLYHLRRNVGMVLQEPFLYSRSIRENIGITLSDPTAEDIRDAVRIACIQEVETEFEQGFETMVGERGVTVSGGQKQRIAIARMLLQQTPLMVFDDSLSAMDTQTDAAIRTALRRRRQHATTFIISHRINTLREADLILVLNEGRIVEQGTHEQLMDQLGHYAQVYALQNDEMLPQQGGEGA